MSNNRNKGKRIERWFKNQLKDFWPDIRRNAGTQSQSGGVDLEETSGWAWEVKGGKSYVWKGVRDILDQAQEQGKEDDIKIAAVKPHYEEPYALIPWSDFLRILSKLDSENLL